MRQVNRRAASVGNMDLNPNPVRLFMIVTKHLLRGLPALAALATLIAGTPSVRAETLTVAARSVADEKAVFATVESISVVPARGRIGGIIVQLNVREGDPVTSGQAVAAIGDEKLALQMKSLDAQIDALQAQSNQAQIDFDRTEGLVERGILPRVQTGRSAHGAQCRPKRAAGKDRRTRRHPAAAQ